MAQSEATPAPDLRLGHRVVASLFVRIALFSFFLALLTLSAPLYLSHVFDQALPTGSIRSLTVLTSLTLGLVMAFGVLDYARVGLMSRAAARYERQFQAQAFRGALRGSLVISGGEPWGRPLADLRTLRALLSSPAFLAMFDVLWSPFFLAIVFMIHWQLGVLALAGMVVMTTLALVNERWSRGQAKRSLEAERAADTVAIAALRNAAAAEAMGMSSRLQNVWRTYAQEASRTAADSATRIGAVAAAMKASQLIALVLMVGLGAKLAIEQAITPGAMLAAAFLASRAVGPIEETVSQWRLFATAATAYRRLATFFDGLPKPSYATNTPDLTGAMSVQGLTCVPFGSERPALKDVTFDLPAGSALGVIGPSAAGKSTLARVLAGVEPIVAGSIKLDGVDLQRWPRELLGARIGYMPQDVELFAGSVAANIARFESGVPRGKVEAAAVAAGAHTLIESLPNGYDTEVGDAGRNLAAGQRQRVGLARALYGDPALVILDEPNANLDAEGDAALDNAIAAMHARGATVIIVTHRPGVVRQVDTLLFLDGGMLRAFGPRDDVLARIVPHAPAQAAAASAAS